MCRALLTSGNAWHFGGGVLNWNQMGPAFDGSSSASSGWTGCLCVYAGILWVCNYYFFSSKNSVGLRNSAQPCLTYGNRAASLQCHCSREAAACRARGKFLCFCSTRFLWLKEEPVQHSGRAEGHARLNSELCCYTEGRMGFVINCSAGGPK